MSSSSHVAIATTRSTSGLVLGIILIGANLRAPITSLGPVLPDIQSGLGLSDTGAGLLNALPLLIFAVLSLVAPAIGRRYGLERILGSAILAILVGMLLRSSPLPGAIWIGTTLLSAGIAFGNVLLPGLVKRDFPTRASGLIGLYAAAMAGTAGLSAGLAVPISRLPGSDWRWSLGAWALLSLATLILWVPQWRGPQHHLAGPGAQAKPSVSTWRHPIGWQVSLFFAFHSFVFYALVDWFASYAVSSGLTLATAGFYLLVYQVIAISTNLGTASLIHRFKDQSLLGFGCGLLLLIGSIGMLLSPGLSLFWLGCAGLGAGVAMVTSLSLFALRTHDHHQAAALSGMAQFIGYVGAAFGPLLVGLLHEATGAWSAPMCLLVVASLLVMAFATRAGRSRFIGEA